MHQVAAALWALGLVDGACFARNTEQFFCFFFVSIFLLFFAARNIFDGACFDRYMLTVYMIDVNPFEYFK